MWSCICVWYCGGHVCVCDIEVVMYVCVISRQIHDHLDILHTYMITSISHTNTWPPRYPTLIHDHFDILHKYMITSISHTNTWPPRYPTQIIWSPLDSEVVIYLCGISRCSCMCVWYLGGHVLVWDIEVVMYLCVISRWSYICVGYRSGHVFVCDIEVVMYLSVISR
jgi:hypothetical protein